MAVAPLVVVAAVVDVVAVSLAVVVAVVPV